MNKPVTVDLFVEDRAHEAFLSPLVERIAADVGVKVSVRVRSARGGHGRAIQEFQLYQNLVEKGALHEGHPDLLIVAIDGNCTTFTKKRKEIQKATTAAFSHRLVVACPNPHVECWYLADPDSFSSVIGYRPTVRKKKCARDYYKQVLAGAVREAGQPATLGGIEFAQELVSAMDFYRASKNDSSLKAFVTDLRGKLQQAQNS